jgi:hypothetical protein
MMPRRKEHRMITVSTRPRPSTPRRRRPAPLALAVFVLILSAGAGPASAAVVERFNRDPLTGRGGNAFFAEGDPGERFTYLKRTPPRFPGDGRGSLRVLYDTTRPQARISTPIGTMVSFDDDFEFGAIMTIRSAGFFADPNGFSQIAFGLWNSSTTGPGRTLFPSNSFDLIEFDYFPNLTSFGGPFVSPSIFGGEVGGNAFFNFTFLSVETALPFDVPLLCRFVHDAATRRLTLQIGRLDRGSTFREIPGGRVVVDTGALNPTFLVDVVGIAAYFEGFASLRASVDYDLLYFGDLPSPIVFGSRRPLAQEGPHRSPAPR